MKPASNALSRISTMTDTQRTKLVNLVTASQNFFGSTDKLQTVKSLKRDEAETKVYLRMKALSNSSFISILDQNVIKVSMDLEEPCYYTFDHVFDATCQSETIFAKTAEHLIDDVISGQTGVYFAYGSPVTGDFAEPTLSGVITQVISSLFEHIYEHNEDCVYNVYLQYFQFYCNTFQDLFNPDNTSLHIREENGEVFIDGLVQAKVESAEEACVLITAGLDQQKSRSHCVLCVEIEKEDKMNEIVTTGRLAIVDLACPERINRKVTAKKAEESKAINTSLSALANVLNCLQSKKGILHIPYRSSKFTRTLQAYLSPASKIAVLITVDPGREFLKETMAAFNFALRCKDIVCTQIRPAVEGKTPPKSPTMAEKLKQSLTERERVIQDLLKTVTETAKEFDEVPEIELDSEAEYDKILTTAKDALSVISSKHEKYKKLLSDHQELQQKYRENSESSAKMLELFKGLIEKFYDKITPEQSEVFIIRLKEKMQELHLSDAIQEDLIRYCIVLESKAREKYDEITILENACRSIVEENNAATNLEPKEENKELLEFAKEETKFQLEVSPIQTEENDIKNAKKLLKLSKDFVRVFFSKATNKLLSEDPMKPGCLPTKCVNRRRRKSKRANLMYSSAAGKKKSQVKVLETLANESADEIKWNPESVISFSTTSVLNDELCKVSQALGRDGSLYSKGGIERLFTDQ